MNSRTRLLFLILFFSVIISSSFALLVTVSIAPEKESMKEFYSFENAEYNIIVLNNEAITINDFKLKASVEEGLQIIGASEKPLKEKEFVPMEIPSGGIRKETIILSGKENAEKEFKIFVEYGISKYEYKIETTIKTKKNPVEFNALIEKFSGKEAAKNSVIIDFMNASEKKIYDVKIELQQNESIEIKSNPIEFDEMASNESIAGKPIEFINLKKIEKPIILEVKAEFSDETGKHELSKKIEAKASQENFLLGGALILILLIGAGIMFLGKKKEEHDAKEHIEHGIPESSAKTLPSLEEEKEKLMNEGNKSIDVGKPHKGHGKAHH